MNAPLAERRPAEILLVDDQEDYLELMCEVFKECNQVVNLHRAKDGEEGMAFLRKQGRFMDAPTPDVILLDLNMPRMDGREVMLEISNDESLRHLPVVIMTSSADEQEVLSMYQLRCSSYIVKPVRLDQLMRFVQSFSDYWLTVAVLPSAQ
jgi:CheY-like chemotaxis protein